MPHAHEDLLRTSYRALESGDMSTYWVAFADDVVVHIPGRSVLKGDHAGKQAAKDLMARWTELSGGAPFSTFDVLANDSYGVVLQTASVERGGKQKEAQLAVVHRFRDGRIVETWYMRGRCGILPRAQDD